MTEPLLIFLIGAGGGALSGLLGIGGGIVTPPQRLAKSAWEMVSPPTTCIDSGSSPKNRGR